jgi:hypothetical protein
MAKFISSVVFNNSALASLKTDPEAGRKIFDAVFATQMGGDTLIKVGDTVVGQAVESHLEDQTRCIAVSGKGGRDLGEAGKAANMDPGNERTLLEALSANFNLVVRKEAVRGEKEESTDAGATAPATTPAAS